MLSHGHVYFGTDLRFQNLFQMYFSQLLVDLQGPELRTGTISEPVSLKNGDIVEICGIPEKVKDSSVSGADRKEIAQKSENKDIEKIPAEKNTFGKGS